MIGEHVAWELVRAVVPGSAVAGTARVGIDSDPEVWMDVDSDGVWRCSHEVSDAARDVFDLFLPIRTPEALVIGQMGQSLDGRIATESGASHFVTGREDIVRLHRVRALVDAVIVGARTVALDDPLLTVRRVEGASPVRVVLDPSERLGSDRRVFSGPGTQTLVVRRAGRRGGSARTEDRDIEVPWIESVGLDLRALVDELRARGLRRVLVEGGGLTVSGFLGAGLLDRLHICVAPILIGSGRASISLDPVASLDDALRPRCRRFLLGEDVLFDLDLRG